MNPHKSKSLSSILKLRQQEDFVGRQRQRLVFERNLTLPIERRSFILNVSGQGGIGKTNLLRHFRMLAEEVGALTVWCDFGEKDAPSVIGMAIRQLEAQGCQLRKTAERYKVYRQRRQELESDPEAPQGLPAFLGKSLAKTGIHFARRAPAIGVAFDFVDEETLALQAGDWMTYLARKITNKDELRLVKEPAEILSPLFWEELTPITETQPVVIFFDTYEMSSATLDAWLRGCLDDRYGELPANIMIVIAGQHELDRNLWASYETIISRLPLEAFTLEETRDFLARKGIKDERVVKDILTLSGGLPLLVATLASEIPKEVGDIGDPTITAVERFLKWIDAPDRRLIAVNAALPRRLNRDVLGSIAGVEDADLTFGWLQRMPFFQAETLTYHPVVRNQLIRHKHRQSPQGWREIHEKLASYYLALLMARSNDTNQQSREPSFQEHKLEFVYHQLCASQTDNMFVVGEALISALSSLGIPFATRLTETVIQGD